MFLLDSGTPVLSIGHQGVGNVPECSLDRLLVSKDHLLALSLRQSHARLQPSTLDIGCVKDAAMFQTPAGPVNRSVSAGLS